MKATGIVRRIDDLGRIVIPKEISRSFHIREGDPLEIFLEEDGGVVFKKYSIMGEFSSYAKQMQNALSSNGIAAAIFDNDGILCGPRSFGITRVPDDWIDIRSSATKWESMFITPILVNGDQVGFICYKNSNNEESVHDMVKLSARFLANICES